MQYNDTTSAIYCQGAKGDIFLNTMNLIVAKNIKRLREEKKLSMDELSRLSGVSKSMLAQIERGEGNPTISTLWKLSNGMQVPFDALTVRPKIPYELVKISDIQPLLEDGGRFRNYPIFPDDEDRRFAAYYLELEQESYMESEPHLKGTTEFVTVFFGNLEIMAEGKVFTLTKGESIRFRGDQTHSYRNVGEETVVLHMILYNP